jgi:hypothetical protein
VLRISQSIMISTQLFTHLCNFAWSLSAPVHSPDAILGFDNSIAESSVLLKCNAVICLLVPRRKVVLRRTNITSVCSHTDPLHVLTSVAHSHMIQLTLLKRFSAPLRTQGICSHFTPTLTHVYRSQRKSLLLPMPEHRNQR